MDFQQRLKKAIERGEQVGRRRELAEEARALNEQELQRLHSQYRLELSEHIEQCLRQVADRFPGFRFETVLGDRGWGAAISRDDLRLGGGQRTNLFSRLEMVIRPFSSYHVLELVAKGAIYNREVFNRTHFHDLAEVNLNCFFDTIDVWVIEYAELYAAKR
jgi:hypothetical protein